MVNTQFKNDKKKMAESKYGTKDIAKFKNMVNKVKYK